MARLFFAVWPPDDVVEGLTALRRKDQRGVRFVRPENWHSHSASWVRPIRVA